MHLVHIASVNLIVHQAPICFLPHNMWFPGIGLMLLLPSSERERLLHTASRRKALTKIFSAVCFVFINNLFNHIKSRHRKFETVSLKLFSFHNFCGSKGAKEQHGRSEWSPQGLIKGKEVEIFRSYKSFS